MSDVEWLEKIGIKMFNQTSKDPFHQSSHKFARRRELSKKRYTWIALILIMTILIMQVRDVQDVHGQQDSTNGSVASHIILSVGVINSPQTDQSSLPGIVFQKSISYLSQYNQWNTSNEVLTRDFTRFKNDGIQIVDLALYWYTIEGKRGEYNNTILDGFKRAILAADETGLKVRVSLIAPMGYPSLTPAYVIDPVTGQNDALAIVRSPDMEQAFLNMYNYTVSYLVGMPIMGWTILGEPWYSPVTLPAPYNNINQKENFINLMEQLTKLVKSKLGSNVLVDVNFVSVNIFTQDNGLPAVTNLFELQWQWDPRIFQTLDYIRFSYNPFDPLTKWPGNQETYNEYANITKYNCEQCAERDKAVYLTLSADGGSSNDSSIQNANWNKMLQDINGFSINGLTAFAWNSEAQLSLGTNLCANISGDPRDAYNEFLNYEP